MSIGIMELVVIFLVAIFAFGGKNGAGVAKALGRGLKKTKTFTENMREGFRETVEPINEIKADVADTVNEIKAN